MTESQRILKFRLLNQLEKEQNCFQDLGRGSEKPDDNKQEKDAETETVSNNDSSEVSESNDNFGLIIRDEREYPIKNLGV